MTTTGGFGALQSALARMRGRNRTPGNPIVISTWDFGNSVTETAWNILKEGGSALDAVEAAVRIPEADPNITSVGYGGYPDRDGKVTLDASIMDGDGRCGSVMFLEHIMHPISVARRVMERTEHVMLAGDGAFRFALENGFKKENLLTPRAEKAYREWLQSSGYVKPELDDGNHDTIGLLAMDKNGKLAGACTTSGLKWKIHGRVGDSPIIGAGLYVDNEAGAATATGIGESVIRIAGSYLIVECMRNGKSPAEAIRFAIDRLLHKQPQYRRLDEFIAGFIAMNRDGEIAALSCKRGLKYSLCTDGKNRVIDAACVFNE
jgi:L-asparaginase/N4-(beta-N-acetylglucosaminyl)-L-asparaginase